MLEIYIDQERERRDVVIPILTPLKTLKVCLDEEI